MHARPAAPQVGKGNEMSTNGEYAAEEPERTTRYRDITGALHNTRDAAIRANYLVDFEHAVAGHSGTELYDADAGAIVKLIMEMAEYCPHFLRIALGDRDAT